MGETIVIAFKDGHAYLSADFSLPMSATNIPTTYQPFKPGIFWTVDIIRYDPTFRKLITRISLYQGSSSQFCQQKPFPHEVEEIVINNITSTGMMPAWDKGKWMARHAAALRERSPEERPSKGYAPTPPITQGSFPPLPTQVPSQPVVKTEELKLRIPFLNLTYDHGAVSFEYTLDYRFPSVKVQVPNSCIHPEFKFVTPYLAKILKREDARFNVRLRKETLSGVVQSVAVEWATSPDVDRITTDVIEIVSAKYIVNAIFKGNAVLDDVMQPVKNAQSPLNNEDDPRQVLEAILGVRESKHRKQLEFLATRHREDMATLQFTADPVAFLFLLDGVRSYFFVLEVYDQTLATYVWECVKDAPAIQAKLEELKSLMVTFRSGGRLAYRGTRPEGFSLIEHDYSDEAEGFLKWKESLDRISRG